MPRRISDTERGFSLLELLIVVAIIMIIATIAIPSFLRSRQAAHESAAAASLKNVNVAQNVYLMTNHVFGSLGVLIGDGLLIDGRYATTLSGYNFAVALTPDSLDYVATANAATVEHGRYDYYTTPDYVIRYSTNPLRAPAGMAGQPVR